MTHYHVSAADSYQQKYLLFHAVISIENFQKLCFKNRFGKWHHRTVIIIGVWQMVIKSLGLYFVIMEAYAAAMLKCRDGI